MDVGYAIGLEVGIVWIFPKWVDYENFHMWPKWFVGINYVSKWVYESIMSNYVKKNIKNV